jgi:hypothetical protein
MVSLNWKPQNQYMILQNYFKSILTWLEKYKLHPKGLYWIGFSNRVIHQ